MKSGAHEMGCGNLGILTSMKGSRVRGGSYALIVRILQRVVGLRVGQRRAEAQIDPTSVWAHSATSAGAVAAEPLDLTVPMASGRGRQGRLALA